VKANRCRREWPSWDDQLKRASISNPVNGTVLEKYAEAGEMTAAGKALYKIADLSVMTLRAYVTGTQLPQIKLGQQVTVMIDDGNKKYREMPAPSPGSQIKQSSLPRPSRQKKNGPTSYTPLK